MRKGRAFVGTACVLGFLVAMGCATGPGEAQFRNDLAGTWVNPGYEGNPYLFYPVIKIDGDLEMGLYRQMDAVPSLITLGFESGETDRSGATYYTVRMLMSIGEGFIVFRLDPSGHLEFVYSEEPASAVVPEMGGYRGVYTRL